MTMAYLTLHDRLRGPIAEALKKDLKIGNVHALPKIVKVVVNVGINRSKMEGKEMREYIGSCLAKITGQKAVFTLARKAISNFKTRENMVVGAMVTLHGRKMEEFLDRLLSYSIPRIRDFRGLPGKLDGHGSYSIGIRDHSIFPEIPPPDVKQMFGLQVLIATNTHEDEHARALLKHMGMPFQPERKHAEAKNAPAEEAKESVAPSKKKRNT
ncbi:TPA: 50S ribosomal protein L5 [Candidatus Peribacteria bacterium]|nr:MAG: 50S ribosomal protein L5 [Candidatus Peribacteria bacterium RIFOXYC2_FULL_58_10]HAI98994.1 50S ribosomal protein L5 [Candidatus Peribacteria bacterium]HAS34799.1 50S ribosomal protein L5 [Candidatus Peribacteria bacterium]